MNSFGRIFRVSIWGESHGNSVGIVVDGVPAGIELSEQEMMADLARRKSGAVGTTPRVEADQPNIISGLFEGHTTGAPLTILFSNTNTRSGDYAKLKAQPRPSHADFTGMTKFDGWNDPRGGGHFSGRLTLGLVAAGVIAKKILNKATFQTNIVELGGSHNVEEFEEIVLSAVAAGDSVGGVIECRVDGLPVGMGEPFFDSVESVVAHALFAVPAVKGVEFGAGFECARMRGSEHNDPIINKEGVTLTNNAGGIVGGITNGNQFVVRTAIKPTASIAMEQQTYNFATNKVEPLEIGGRHDACIAMRAGVVVESAIAIALADLYLLGKK
ncbi:MAG: chorismate synthase [Rikenellaceae bacterium]|nr:chorismate synthase [Rikenellaceae bacterium]